MTNIDLSRAAKQMRDEQESVTFTIGGRSDWFPFFDMADFMVAVADWLDFVADSGGQLPFMVYNHADVIAAAYLGEDA